MRPAVSLFLLCNLLAISSLGAGDPPPGSTPVSNRQSAPKRRVQAERVRRFWDSKNDSLFAGVAAVRALDYTSTRHFRARGAHEILLSNWVVDHKPLFVGIEAGGALASVGLSYVFHKTNHHQAERWVSIIHIGVGGFGDARNYTLGKRAH